MKGWLVRVTEGDSFSLYAVHVARQREALQQIARTLRTSPMNVAIVEELSEPDLNRFGAHPGRVAKVGR